MVGVSPAPAPAATACTTALTLGHIFSSSDRSFVALSLACFRVGHGDAGVQWIGGAMAEEGAHRFKYIREIEDVFGMALLHSRKAPERLSEASRNLFLRRRRVGQWEARADRGN